MEAHFALSAPTAVDFCSNWFGVIECQTESPMSSAVCNGRRSYY